jgi:hypothetical protein
MSEIHTPGEIDEPVEESRSEPVEESPVEESRSEPVIESRVESDEAVEAEADEAVEEPREQKKVDLGALHEERAKRRDLERRLEGQERAFQEFQARLAERDAPQPPPVPEFDEDPAANLDARMRAQEAAIRQSQETDHQRRQRDHDVSQLQNFQQDFYVKEQTFANKTPDYYEAVNWLRSQRGAELKSMGYGESDVARMVDQEALSYAVTATQNGVDPAPMFYNVAVQRGYSKGRGTDLNRLAANQAQARSVGPSGQTGTGNTTLAELANMSDDDFDKLTSGDKWKKLWQ